MRRGVFRLAAAFALGLLLGAAGMTVRLGDHVDELVLVNNRLQERLAAAEEELAQWQRSSRQKGLITAVDPEIVFPGDELPHYQQEDLRLKLEQEVRSILAPLKGQPARQVDYQMIPVALEGRVVEVEGQRFAMRVMLVVATERLLVRLEVRPYGPES